MQTYHTRPEKTNTSPTLNKSKNTLLGSFLFEWTYMHLISFFLVVWMTHLWTYRVSMNSVKNHSFFSVYKTFETLLIDVSSSDYVNRLTVSWFQPFEHLHFWTHLWNIVAIQVYGSVKTLCTICNSYKRGKWLLPVKLHSPTPTTSAFFLIAPFCSMREVCPSI